MRRAHSLQPVLDDLRKTSAQANQTLDHVDAMIGENRPDIHQAVLELRESLATVTTLTGRLNQTVDVNSDNIDEAAGQSPRCDRKPEGNYGHNQGAAIPVDTFEPSA